MYYIYTMKEIRFKLASYIVLITMLVLMGSELVLVLVLMVVDLLVRKVKGVKIFKARSFPSENYPQLAGDK